MIWQSTKARDLERDPRLTVHSLPPGLSNPDGDIKLYGVAVPLDAPGKRAYEKTLHARMGWSPTEPYHCFAYDVTSAGLVRFRGHDRESWYWRAGQPMRKTVTPNVD